MCSKEPSDIFVVHRGGSFEYMQLVVSLGEKTKQVCSSHAILSQFVLATCISLTRLHINGESHHK